MSLSVPDPSTEVLLRHAAWVRRLAGDLVRDPGAADDIAQATMVAYLEQRPSLGASVRPWLATVVKRQAALWRRRGAGRTARERSVARPEATPDTTELVERAELQRTLVDKVLALPDPYRSVILLRYYEGLVPSAIAELLGRPDATVRTQLRRGRERLRELLDRESGGDRDRWAARLAPLALAPVAERAPRALWIGAAVAVGAAVALTATRVALGDRSETRLGREAVAVSVEGPVAALAAPGADAERRALEAGPKVALVRDARSGAALAHLELEIDGQLASTDADGRIELDARAQAIRVRDAEHAVEVVVAHGVRARRASPSAAPIPWDGGDTILVDVGPALEFEFGSGRVPDPSAFEVQLAPLIETPYGDDARRRYVTGLRAPSRTARPWARFAPAAWEAGRGAQAWRATVRSRDGFTAGAARIDRLDPGAPVAIELAPRAVLRGHVAAPGSTTGAAATSVASLGPRGGGNAVVAQHLDEAGDFELRWVEPGDYELVVTAAGHEQARVEVELAAGELAWREIELVPLIGLRAFEGDIMSSSGAFAEQLLVHLLDAEGGVFEVFPTSWSAEPPRVARFAFEGVPEGAYRLEVVSLGSCTAVDVPPLPFAGPATDLVVTVRDDQPAYDVVFDVRDAANDAALAAFEVVAAIDGGAERSFSARGVPDERAWSFSCLGLRWNEFGGPAPLRNVRVGAAIEWTVRANGAVVARGDETDIVVDGDGARVRVLVDAAPADSSSAPADSSSTKRTADPRK